MVDLNIQLPESFFQEEVRDGYLVSKKIKELWAVQLDLLHEFDRVCKKHNLKYFLDFGTLLGAVRHKGFIPWDEDIDVSMLREDYDKLMEIAPKEFKHPYFLQNYKTQKNYRFSVTRLRRSDTAFFQPEDLMCRVTYNLGIFIDIFVFDNVPSNNRDEIAKIHDQCMDLHGKVSVITDHNFKCSNPLLAVVIYLRHLGYKMKYGSTYKVFNQMDAISKQFKETGYVSCLFTRIPVRCRRKEWLNEIVYLPFETLLMPVPVAYDEVLKECYGDYKTPVIDSSIKYVYSDASHSYKEIINEKGYEGIMKELSMNNIKQAISTSSLLNVIKKKVIKLFRANI